MRIGKVDPGLLGISLFVLFGEAPKRGAGNMDGRDVMDDVALVRAAHRAAPSPFAHVLSVRLAIAQIRRNATSRSFGLEIA